MYWHFAALGILSVLILAGAWYRLAAGLYFLGFTYVFLLEQANYLNHFYLISLVSLLMVFVPAHRALSIDARRSPSLRSETISTWSLWLLRFQIGVPYFFGGIAKLNADWLRGEPIRGWLAEQADAAVIGPLLSTEGMTYAISYGGLMFDLAVVPLLLWRRTRVAAFLLAVAFNLANAFLFSIGIFPWFMIAATTLFFEPDWPRRVVRRFGIRVPDALAEAGPSRSTRHMRVAAGLLAGYVAVQVLVPFRHLLYPGDVSWTEEGHRFAWHMKLRGKSAHARFVVSTASGLTWTIDPSGYLSRRQASKMPKRPDMVLQFAHFLADEFRARGFEGVEVRAQVTASLNHRESRVLIDPGVDLAREPRSLRHASWIAPLE